jgi:MFS family permease
MQGAIASMGVAGALLGSIVVFGVADTWGRRKELIVGSVFYMIGESSLQLLQQAHVNERT